MGLFKFYWTDAIASAGGTTIKYIDTQTATLINPNLNIIGAKITDRLEAGYYGIIQYRFDNNIIFYAISNSGTIHDSFAFGIRVFYY